MKQKQTDWEKRFDKKFRWRPTGSALASEIKDFIEKELAQREAEVKQKCEAEQVSIIMRMEEDKINLEREAFEKGERRLKGSCGRK